MLRGWSSTGDADSIESRDADYADSIESRDADYADHADGRSRDAEIADQGNEDQMQ